MKAHDLLSAAQGGFMPEPLLATGLATDWLKKLHKLWADLRESRRQEFLEIKNVFGDPELLARFYIEPDCQHINPADHDEDEPGHAIRQPMRAWLNEFLKGEFFQRDGRNTGLGGIECLA